MVDDSLVCDELKKEFEGADVLLIAPGKSIDLYKQKIDEILEKPGIISIGLNLTTDFGTTYILTTRKDVYEQAVNDGKNVIVTSAVSKGGRGNVKILNYKNWIIVDERTHDSSSVIATKLLVKCGVKRIYLAGFDGFSSNINENYSDPNMRRPVNDEQALRRNVFYKKMFNDLKNKGVEVVFITPSKYE